MKDKEEIIYNVVKKDPIGLQSRQISSKIDLDLNSYQVSKICRKHPEIIERPNTGRNGRKRWIDKDKLKSD